VSKNSSIVACIRYRGNVSAEPVPSNDRGIFTGPLPKLKTKLCGFCPRANYTDRAEPLLSNGKGIFTEPLHSNNRGIFTQLLPSNDKGILTKPLPSNDRGIFTEPLPSNDRGIHRHTQQRDLISLFLFFQNKESRLIGDSSKLQCSEFQSELEKSVSPTILKGKEMKTLNRMSHETSGD
jgi:hypothetical protein